MDADTITPLLKRTEPLSQFVARMAERQALAGHPAPPMSSQR